MNKICNIEATLLTKYIVSYENLLWQKKLMFSKIFETPYHSVAPVIKKLFNPFMKLKQFNLQIILLTNALIKILRLI